MGDGKPFVSGLILAGGSSRRLGRPKQLLDLGGEPLLRHTIRNALGSSLEEVILVLGSRAGEVAEAVGELGQRTVVNPDFAEGQSTSLRRGLDAVSTDAEAVLVLLGDQPLVSSTAIDRLVARSCGGGREIVQASYGGEAGTPVLFAGALLRELAAVTGDRGARDVVRRHRDRVRLVEIGDVADVVDVDTDADYRRLLERWRGRGAP